GAAALLWCPVAWLLYDAIGTVSLPATSVLLALTLSVAAPAGTGAGPWVLRALGLSAAAAAAIALVAAALLPPYSPDNPRQLNLLYWVAADRSDARWLASAATGRLPAALAQ